MYNQEAILRAFSLIKNDYPDYKLIILCCNNPDSIYMKNLKHLEKGLEITGSVIWIPRLLSEQEIADIFSFSEVFINIPKSDQLAATLVEGIACGCFSIAATLSAYDLVIQDEVNGLLVNPTPIAVANVFKQFYLKKDYYMAQALENAKRVRRIVGTNDKFLNSTKKWQAHPADVSPSR